MSSSKAKTSRVGQGIGKGKEKATSQAYAIQANYYDTTAGTTVDDMIFSF